MCDFIPETRRVNWLNQSFAAVATRRDAATGSTDAANTRSKTKADI